MIIGIAVYDKVDLLDVTGPYEIFQWMNDAGVPVEVQVVAEHCGDVTTRDGFTFNAPNCFSDVTTVDLLWVPGGHTDSLTKLMTDPRRRYLDFLVRVSRDARFVASVCEGALLLAQAGLLDGYEATTHWAFIPCLKQFPDVTVVEGHPRFVVDRNRVTGGGISSGLDEAFKLVELLSSYEVAQKVQRSTQYYPCPPVQSALSSADTCPFRW